MEDWLESFQANGSLSSYEYIVALKRVLFAIAAHGSAVILGRGGNFCLPPERRIGLRLVAPLDTRIQNVMKERKCSRTCASENIAKLEMEQRKFVKKYFDADITDPARFHLVVNTALVDSESIVRLVKAMIEARTPDRRPVRA